MFSFYPDNGIDQGLCCECYTKTTQVVDWFPGRPFFGCTDCFEEPDLEPLRFIDSTTIPASEWADGVHHDQ